MDCAALQGSVSLRWVIAVVASVAAAVGISVAVAAGVDAREPRRRVAPPPSLDRRLAPEHVVAAVDRTVAAGSARIDATYVPAHGPPVSITGRTSFTGPDAEVSAGVAGEPPAQVRVTASGAWVRAPGADGWTPVPVGLVPPPGARGWAEVLRQLGPSSEVWSDAAGRVARVRLARGRRGGVLDVRFSDFGIEVVTVPP